MKLRYLHTQHWATVKVTVSKNSMTVPLHTDVTKPWKTKSTSTLEMQQKKKSYPYSKSTLEMQQEKKSYPYTGQEWGMMGL